MIVWGSGPALRLFFVLVVCPYFMVRNEWVYRRRDQLIDWWVWGPLHASGVLDQRFGTYKDWLYGRPFTWDAGKIAGVDWNEVKSFQLPDYARAGRL